MTDMRQTILEMIEAQCDNLESLLHGWTEALRASGDIKGAKLAADRVRVRALEVAHKAERRAKTVTHV